MLIARQDQSQPAKGWYTELFHLPLPAIGFANQGIDEPHYHRELHEVYLVARGSSTLVVNGSPIALQAGDVVIVEPGEWHTFAQSSLDYFHFVLHCPRIRGDKVPVEIERS